MNRGNAVRSKTETHIPLEVRRDGKVNLEDGACDGLHMGHQLQLGEHVDEAAWQQPHDQDFVLRPKTEQ